MLLHFAKKWKEGVIIGDYNMNDLDKKALPPFLHIIYSFKYYLNFSP